MSVGAAGAPQNRKWPPVLFLDMDGVMNCGETFKRRGRGTEGYGRVDQDKVALLNEIVTVTGCRVVMSSTWRSDHDFRERFRRRGARVRYHRDWRIGHLSDGDPDRRGREIAEWLARHPEVSTYAIVDDDSDMLPEQKLHHFVQTSFAVGLTRFHADALIDILQGGVGRAEALRKVASALTPAPSSGAAQ